MEEYKQKYDVTAYLTVLIVELSRIGHFQEIVIYISGVLSHG